MTLATLTYTDGAARLQVAPPSLLGEAPITLTSGATLRFDPGDPTRLLSATIPSGDLDDLANAVTLRADMSEPFDAESIERPIAVIEASQLLAGMQRLAFAEWNARWTPLPVERPLVMLDVATAAWSAGPGLRLRAFDIFDEYAEQLQAVVDNEVGEKVVATGAREALQETVAACAAALGDDDPRVSGLVESAALLTLSEGVRNYSTSGVRAVEDIGLGSADWANVPPRTLHTDEGHVTWERRTSDDLVSYTVSATGHPCLDPRAPSTERLLVRLVNETTGQVVVAEPLTLDGSDALRRPTFMATIELDPSEDTDELVPDIVDARVALRRTARVGEAALTARDERQAIRALAWSRLEAAAAATDSAWSPLFSRAVMERDDLRDAVSDEQSVPARATLTWLDTVEETGVDLASPPSHPLLSEWITISRMVRKGAAL